jgi:hypothetical protein
MMLNLRYLFLFPAFLCAGLLFAQQPIFISIKNSTFATTDSVLPFWFTANQQGKIRSSGSVLNITDMSFGQLYHESAASFGYTWGTNLVAAFAESGYYQANQLFAGIVFKGWELKGGMFHEPTQYADLSTTNGNLVRSQNARPHPRLRFGTIGFKEVPFMNNRLQFRAEYDEGILNDDRFVNRTRLHHKSLFLRFFPAPSWSIEGGLEHFVMWGGTSPVASIGKMPSGFSSYRKYVLGLSGDEEFPLTDQLNIAGNHLGTYQFRVKKRFSSMEATFYLSHLFEDLSGMNWRNWPDNLLGLHISFANKQQFITDIVYEYTNTRQQSIRGPRDRQEPDSYFNNGVYRSGFTYHQQVMGSPLFFPVILREGIALGLESNRFYAHHLGARGNFQNSIQWKGMLTYIHHFGRYFIPYEPSEKQLSGLMEIQYKDGNLPFELGLAAAVDAGNIHDVNQGIRLWIAKKW